MKKKLKVILILTFTISSTLLFVCKSNFSSVERIFPNTCYSESWLLCILTNLCLSKSLYFAFISERCFRLSSFSPLILMLAGAFGKSQQENHRADFWGLQGGRKSNQYS